jgi:formylglycine-generating enzyme required for sulfatase activity
MRVWALVMGLLAAAAGGAMVARWYQHVPAVAQLKPAQHCTLAATDPAHPDMVWVPGGSFTMGSNHAFPEEGPEVAAKVAGFWMDQTEVTNAQFAAFVAATGYRTLARRESA